MVSKKEVRRAMSPQEKKMEDHKRSQEKGVKFVKLASARASKAIKAIRNIGNLSNRSSYVYTDPQVRQLIEALAKEVKAVEARFSAPAAKSADAAFVFAT